MFKIDGQIYNKKQFPQNPLLETGMVLSAWYTDRKKDATVP